MLLSADLGSEDSTIVVIDDGEGMDESGLRNHWIIGESGKRKKGLVLPKGRKQIGKFGIGKLATYVLAKPTQPRFKSEGQVLRDKHGL